VVGCYPGAGADNTPDEYLPHIALMRRTLPWEREAFGTGAAAKPWMALLTVKASEIRTGGGNPIETCTVKAISDRHHDVNAYNALRKAGYLDDTSLDFLWLDESLLPRILPTKDELKLLCHRQKLTMDPKASLSDLDSMWKLDDDCDVAIV